MPGENLDAVVNENKGETEGTGLETLELGNGGKSVSSCWNWYFINIYFFCSFKSNAAYLYKIVKNRAYCFCFSYALVQHNCNYRKCIYILVMY